MNKKLKKMLWPGLWLYMLTMAVFVVATAVLGQYILAAAEGAIFLLVLMFYALVRNRRRKYIQHFVKTHFNPYEADNASDTPFPLALVRLGDGVVVWTNDSFRELTGYQDRYMEQTLSSVLPECSINWLEAGKKEAPYDVPINRRRYRVSGTVVRKTARCRA